MYRKFINCLVGILFIVFTMSGCSRAVSNDTNGKVNNSVLSEGISQSQSNTAEVKDGTQNKENSQAKEDINKNNSSENKSTEEASSKIDVKNEKPKDTNTNTKQAKKNNKVIVVDAGHGGRSGSEKEKVSPDSNELKPKNVSGATGVKSKTPEHVIALQVSQKLKKLLEKEGYTVIMTRTSDTQTVGNIERAEIGNKNNADLVIRIHADSSTSSSIKGASMLVPGQAGYAKSIAKVSREYGETILKTLVEEANMQDRGVVTRNDLTGFNWSRVPVVLVEMGFLSNPTEDSLLNSSDYQNKIALGLAKGVDKVFSNR